MDAPLAVPASPGDTPIGPSTDVRAIDRRLVVVMPAYNAALTLERTYGDVPRDLVHRIILVDDVSLDETLEVARQLGLDVIVQRMGP